MQGRCQLEKDRIDNKYLLLRILRVDMGMSHFRGSAASGVEQAPVVSNWQAELGGRVKLVEQFDITRGLEVGQALLKTGVKLSSFVGATGDSVSDRHPAEGGCAIKRVLRFACGLTELQASLSVMHRALRQLGDDVHADQKRVTALLVDRFADV